MNDIKEIIAKNLIKLRKQHRLTQLELAEKINYSDKAISRWENGEVTPDIETLNNICTVYNMPISFLFDENLDLETVQKERNSNNTNKLVISLLAVLCVWTLAVALHVTFTLSLNVSYWQVFIFALPLTFIVAIVFNSLWGKHPWNFVFISCFVWTTLLSFYIVFFKYNIWPVFILGAPLQVSLILWSKLKKNK